MEIGEGARLGRYQIRSLLGKGGMGEVYLAHDPSLRRTVAIKLLRVDFTFDSGRIQRFEREAYSASGLNHPNILTIFEFGKEDNYYFIVTEAVDGQSLRYYVEHGTLTLNEILEIGIQVTSALAAAHEAGIIHRDIKPDNIMLRRDHLVKVLDFGLAKLRTTGSDDTSSQNAEAVYNTMPGAVVGTPRYMSPEQVRGLPVDNRTDIWSLGVVLYNMVTGSVPFDGHASTDVLVSVLTTEPPPITQYVEGVPAELERIIMKALAKDKEKRYSDVNELGEDLKHLKQRLDFEAELERSRGRGDAVSEIEGESARAGLVRLARITAQGDQRATAGGAALPANATMIRSESSAEYIVREIKQHKRAALAILAVLFCATTAVAILTLTGTSNAGIRSLAVLPFANISNDPNKDYLTDGISESLTNQLSQVPGVKVIANSSSVRYKGKDADPQEVGRALDVTGILTGRVAQVGDRLSIRVELIDTRDRTQVWGEHFDSKPTDLFATQAAIARQITERLRLHMSPGEQQKLEKSETVKSDAYELLLKGRFHRFRGGLEDRKRAADYFNQAIAVDPGYAPAYADLADMYRSLIGSSILDPKEYLPKAEAAARKAVQLDESLADGHYALANLRTYAWDWAEAEKEYKRAIELNSNHALAHRWYASYLRLLARHDQAIAEITRARELDPLSPALNATVGFILFSARKHNDAIESLKRTLELDKEYPYTHLFLAFTYSAKGMHSQAIASCQEAMKLGLNTPSTRVFLGTVYANAGERVQAESILKQLQAGSEYVSPGDLATLYAALGEQEQAFASLEKAYQAQDPQLQHLGVSPGFDPMRKDPRFKDLLGKVGLPN